MPRPPRFKSDGLKYLHDRFIGDDPERVASYEKALANADIAQAIYDLRTEAKWTQTELAKRVGTTPSVISRLEDADYDGHSLSMLRRIATALGRRVEIRFPRLEAIAELQAIPEALSRPVVTAQPKPLTNSLKATKAADKSHQSDEPPMRRKAKSSSSESTC
ncbi:XRE family transcriptional regulator [Singulisphaera acidiphila]|uniref:Putative transcriptional regulator n=1 Tax=Singulisphaera acidiphila (strain ATCC BAA-1392 / DSM 18658 / VKM B-2454 / MOB10) TaxID=886293 RepID=L0DRD5_SINAD|nr:XRE family transcriptional regulator [Singulisphaera acidiphila]AGA31537.1 putative transcriptional regulator [Singulisphaera acidiphila DSM 18658]